MDSSFSSLLLHDKDASILFKRLLFWVSVTYSQKLILTDKVPEKKKTKKGDAERIWGQRDESEHRRDAREGYSVHEDTHVTLSLVRRTHPRMAVRPHALLSHLRLLPGCCKRLGVSSGCSWTHFQLILRKDAREILRMSRTALFSYLKPFRGFLQHCLQPLDATPTGPSPGLPPPPWLRPCLAPVPPTPLSFRGPPQPALPAQGLRTRCPLFWARPPLSSVNGSFLPVLQASAET